MANSVLLMFPQEANPLVGLIAMTIHSAVCSAMLFPGYLVLTAMNRTTLQSMVIACQCGLLVIISIYSITMTVRLHCSDDKAVGDYC